MRVILAVLAAALLACGTDVNLGGTTGVDDASGVDVTQCGDLVAPSELSSCKACNADASDCQPNGCYGGYWCNRTVNDCHAPPKTCP